MYVHLTCVLFQKPVPKARGGPSQETRPSLRHGTAQTEAFGSDQTVLVPQPRAAPRVRPGARQESAGAEAPRVCWRPPEGSPSRSLPVAHGSPAGPAECLFPSTDGCTQGHEARRKAVPPAVHPEEGRGPLRRSGLADGSPAGSRDQVWPGRGPQITAEPPGRGQRGEAWPCPPRRTWRPWRHCPAGQPAPPRPGAPSQRLRVS